MLPSLKDYNNSSAYWQGAYKGVAYSINHHSVSEYSPQGIWCFYIYINEAKAADFDKFFRKDEIKKITFFNKTNNYFDIPDEGFHGGITFYENKFHFDHETGEEVRIIKIGCDYAHLWDKEKCNPENLNSIKRDVEKCIDNYIDRGFDIGQAMS